MHAGRPHKSPSPSPRMLIPNVHHLLREGYSKTESYKKIAIENNISADAIF